MSGHFPFQKLRSWASVSPELSLIILGTSKLVYVYFRADISPCSVFVNTDINTNSFFGEIPRHLYQWRFFAISLSMGSTREESRKELQNSYITRQK